MYIDIVSDLICPWCFIGKRRLDEVLASPAGAGVIPRWRPFQLYPQLPMDGLDRATFMRARFGEVITSVVLEVSDDKTLGKDERKRLQIEHAYELSERAKLVKLADKICNVSDIVAAPPARWTLERKRQYLEWAKAVVDRVRGTHTGLEAMFDDVYAKGVRALEQ